MTLNTTFKKAVKIMLKGGITGKNTSVTINKKEYYLSFNFREITEKECPKCKGKGRVDK